MPAGVSDFKRWEDETWRALGTSQEDLTRRVVARSQLPIYGIPWTDMTLYKMVREGEFPPPIKIGGLNYWFLSVLDAWLAERPSWASWMETREDGRRGRKVRSRKAA